MAGEEKTKRAVRIALAVSQDHTLLGKITKPQSGVKTLFHDTELFKKAGVPRRGYLRGKAPPGHRGDPSDKYTDDEVTKIAKHLVKRGDEMWKKGFIEFINMTSMGARKAGKTRQKPEPSVMVNKVSTMLGYVDISWPWEDSTLKIKCGRIWYEIPLKRVQEFAKSEGQRVTVEELPLDDDGVVEDGEEDVHSESIEINEETDAGERVEVVHGTPTKSPPAGGTDDLVDLNTPQGSSSAPRDGSSTPDTTLKISDNDSGTVYHVFHLKPDGASEKLGMIRSPTENARTNTEGNCEKLKEFFDVEVDPRWGKDPMRGEAKADTEWVALGLVDRKFTGQLEETFRGEYASTAVEKMKRKGSEGVFALTVKAVR